MSDDDNGPTQTPKIGDVIVSRVYTHGGLIIMMFWTRLWWNKSTKSFTIVNKYFIITYVQFL